MHPGELCRFTLDPGISGAEGVAEHRGSEAFASQHAEQAGALPAGRCKGLAEGDPPQREVVGKNP